VPSSSGWEDRPQDVIVFLRWVVLAFVTGLVLPLTLTEWRTLICVGVALIAGGIGSIVGYIHAVVVFNRTVDSAWMKDLDRKYWR
jgi:hypothetical protein